MPKHQCAIVNDVRQVGGEYVRLCQVADWRSEPKLYAYIQARRRNGTIRSQKFATTKGQLRNGGVYVHREDVEAVVAEYRAGLVLAEAAPAAPPASPAIPTTEIPSGLAAAIDGLAAEIRRLSADVGDLTAAITLEAEARGHASPDHPAFDDPNRGHSELFVRLPHHPANGRA